MSNRVSARVKQIFTKRDDMEVSVDWLVAHGHFTTDTTNPNTFDDRISAAMRTYPEHVMKFAAVELMVESRGNDSVAFELGHQAIDALLNPDTADEAA